MDVQNYNVALAKNRKNYQETLDEAKAKYQKELETKQAQAEANYKELQQEKIRQNRDLQQDYTVKLSEDQKKLNKTLDEQTNQLREEIRNKQHEHTVYDQDVRDLHRRELQKIRTAYGSEKETIPAEKLYQAQRNIKNKDRFYTGKIEELNDKNAATVDQLQRDLQTEKEALIRKTDTTLEEQAVNISKQYQERSEDTIEAYETRLRNKDQEIENLLFRMNTLSKKLSEKFTRDLNEKLKLKDEILESERKEMKKALEERDVNSQVKLNDQRRAFDAQLHEISIRNEKNMDDVIRRYEQQIEKLNKDHKEEFDTKVRELSTMIRNLKMSHKLEMDGTREYYDHRLRKMQERLADKEGTAAVGVRVVSK